jgi:iron complex outermembrane receptor protein
VGEVGQGNAQAAKFNNIGSANVVDNTSVVLGGGQRLNDTLTFEAETMYSSRTSGYASPYYASVAANIPDVSYPTSSSSSLQSWSWNVTPRMKADWGRWGSTIVGFDMNKSGAAFSDAYSALAQANLIYFGATSANVNDSSNVALLNHSPYIMERFPLTSSIEVSGGLRRQTQQATASDASAVPTATASASQTYSANAADLAFNFSYLDGQKTFIKWNQSFRFPNTDEFWGFDPNTYAPVFNGILQPQVSRAVELGGDWHWGRARLTASVFQSDTRNEIRYDPVSYTNVNEANTIRRTGIKFESTTRATDDLTVSAGGKFQHSLYTGGSYSGNTISSVPDLTLNARANYALANHWSVGGVLTYIGSQYYDGDEANVLDKIPSSTVADVYSNYQSGAWEARFTIKNLTSANYATYGVTEGPSMPYAYYPSDPRAYYLSMKYAF